MTIDYFTVNDFQDFIDTFPFPNKRDFSMGEYVYFLQIDNKSKVEIRSSIGYKGMNDDTGENSIRLRLEDEYGDYIAKGDEAYITRVKGWQNRTQNKIYELIGLRGVAGDCPKCGKPRKVFRSHTKLNPNRRFAKCANCPDTFIWIDMV